MTLNNEKPMKEELLTQEELKEIIHYDPETGVFTWLVGRGRVRKGDVAGCLGSCGYVYVGIRGIKYRVHRLAFLYMNGEFPSDQVDHINRVKDDNRWGNLRLCTSQQNSYNKGKQKNNTSGYRGVRRNGKKWEAFIYVDGRHLHLGVYASKEVAAKIYEKQAKKIFGEFANVGVGQ